MEFTGDPKNTFSPKVCFWALDLKTAPFFVVLLYCGRRRVEPPPQNSPKAIPKNPEGPTLLRLMDNKMNTPRCDISF